MQMRVMDAAQVAEATPWRRLVDALELGIVDGSAEFPDRHVHPMPGRDQTTSSLLVMPAWQRAADVGLVGVKLVTFVPANSSRGESSIHAVYVAFDRDTGGPVAMLDGDALTTRRTAAISVVGARHLARREITRLLVVGSGQLVPALVAAYVDVCGVESVTIWGRNAERTQRAVDVVRPSVRVPVERVDDLETAAGRSDVIVCATASATPLLHGAWVRAGTHVSLLGSFRPDMRESDDELIRRSTLYVDTLPGALSSGDLAHPIGSGAISERHIVGDLRALVQAEAPPGSHHGTPEGVTVFKSVGFASADLLTAELALQSH